MLNYLWVKLLWENNGFRRSDNGKLRIRRSFINLDKMELLTPGELVFFKKRCYLQTQILLSCVIYICRH